MKNASLKYVLLTVTVLALGVWAAAVTIPNTFSEGEVLSASKMNENFDVLASADSGVDFAALDSKFDVGTTITNLGSVTITPPSDGFVLISHQGEAVFFKEGTRLGFGLGTTATVNDLYDGGVGRLDGSSTIRYHYPFGSKAVVEVEAGKDITIYANVQKSSTFDAGTINVGDSFLVATFYANRY